jgi:hypothetical protein
MTTGNEQAIPQRSGVTPPSYVQSYTLSVRTTSSGYLDFYWSSAPSNFDPTKDQPLTMRVPQNCQIAISLDSSWNWEFKHTNPVTLAAPSLPAGNPASGRYYNLVPSISSSSRCTSLSFCADYYSTTNNNVDPVNIYVKLDQQNADGSAALPLTIVIDPDIKNPGDPGH